mgnify:FL=1
MTYKTYELRLQEYEKGDFKKLDGFYTRILGHYQKYLKKKTKYNYKPSLYKLQKGDELWYKLAKQESKKNFGRVARRNA